MKVGGALLAVAWAPFLYAELSSDSAKQKERVLPSDDGHDDTAVVQAVTGAHEQGAGKDAPVPAPAAEAPAAVEPAPAAAEEVPVAQPAAPAAPAAPVAAAAPNAAAAPTGPAEQVQQLAARPGQPAPGAPGDTREAPVEGDELAAADPDVEEPDPTPPTSSGPAEALKQAYDQQPRDALWAADAEAKLGALFGTEEVPGELLRSASCRKAVCRVELRWTSAHATAYVSAYEAAQQLLGGEVGVEPVGSPSEKGEQLVNLYLTRKGYTVADLTR